MQYPSNNEYMRAISSASDNLDKLAHLEPVMDKYGEPFRSSGAFAIVFKMRDPKTNKLYALKCFTAEQPGRNEAYKLISEELETTDTTYLTNVQYLENELFVDCSGEDEVFPVLLMDWVEGVTMDVYIKTHLHDTNALNMLCYRFGKMANWLRNQSFAHGDIKPDNILVREDGTLTLVDYDGMFVPAMKGQKSPTLGTRDFVHPERTPSDFDENIDDFTLASIALSLKAIALKPSLFSKDSNSEGLLFTEHDYRDLPNSKALEQIKELLWDKEISTFYGMFLIAYAHQNLASVSFRLFNTKKPKIVEEEISSEEPTAEELAAAWEDEYGVKYSKDGKRLLKAGYLSGDYIVRNGTKVICDSAFWNCDSLASIHLPDSLTTIGNYAFSNCRSLTSIHLPDSLTTIGDSAFHWCTSLTSIYLPDSLTTIGYRVFSFCFTLESIHLPDSLTTIGDSAFYECKSLESIHLPDSLTTIGNSAFSWCDSLTSIHLPDSLTTIEDSAFYKCKSLTEITLPSSLQEINGNPFPRLKLSITNYSSHFLVEDDVLYTADKKKLIACLSTKNFTIPQGITTIGNSAFFGWKSLRSIHLPDNLTTIGNSAFSDCESLTSIHLPDSLTTIGNYAFSNCRSLTSIHLPDSLTTIGDSAFSRCESLTSIHLPDSLTTIGNSAFSDCESLIVITLPSSLQEIKRNPFTGLKHGNPFAGFNITNYSSCFFVEDNVLYTADKKKLIAYLSTKSNFIVPNGVTTIGDSAFKSCKSLKSIHLPDSLTTIGNSAFYDCESLTSIHLPDSLTTIGNSAFSHCESLISIHLPDSLTTIGNFVFSDCESLTFIHLPDSLTTIGDSAFSRCHSLNSIHLPNSLTTIGDEAFYECVSLISIHLPNSLTTIGKYAFLDCCSLSLKRLKKNKK